MVFFLITIIVKRMKLIIMMMITIMITTMTIIKITRSTQNAHTSAMGY